MKRIVLLSVVAAMFSSCNFVSASNESFRALVQCGFESNDNDKSASITKTIDVTEFTAIELNGGVDLEYTVGAPSLKVVASQKAFDNYRFTVEDGKLVISPINNRAKKLGKIEVYASSNCINKLETNGGCDFEAMSPVVADNFECECNGAVDLEFKYGIKAGKVSFEMNGAGDLELENLDCKEFFIEINGAGDAEVSGKAESTKVDVAGAADLDLRKLQSVSFQKSVSGSAKILQ